MGISYGITIAPKDDRYITVAEIAMDGMGKAATPGAFFVDFIPIRMYPHSLWTMILFCDFWFGFCFRILSQTCAVRFYNSCLLDDDVNASRGFAVNGFPARHLKERLVSGEKPSWRWRMRPSLLPSRISYDPFTLTLSFYSFTYF